jgi:hypothetical protein
MAEIDDATVAARTKEILETDEAIKTQYSDGSLTVKTLRKAVAAALNAKESAIKKVVKATLSAYMEAQAEEAAAADEEKLRSVMLRSAAIRNATLSTDALAAIAGCPVTRRGAACATECRQSVRVVDSADIVARVLDYLEFCDFFPAGVSHCWKAAATADPPTKGMRRSVQAFSAGGMRAALVPQTNYKQQRMSLDTFNKFSATIGEYSDIDDYWLEIGWYSYGRGGDIDDILVSGVDSELVFESYENFNRAEPKVSRVFRAPAGGWTVRSLFDAIAEGDEREWRGDHHFFEGLEKSSNGRYFVGWGS